MINRVDNLSSLRLAIMADTKNFLRGLESGASDEQLRTIAQRIRDKEQLLLHQEGVVLDPEMWRILHSRMINRKVEFADTNSEQTVK
jgi:hypothetical protein